MKKKSLNKYLRSILMVVVLVIAIAAALGAYRTYNYPVEKEVTVTNYSHKWQETIHWESQLLPNRIFLSSNLEGDDLIYKDLTKYLLVDFDTVINSDQAADFDGVVSVTGYLEATYGKDKILLWQRAYELAEPMVVSSEGKTHRLHKSVKVDLIQHKERLVAMDESLEIGAEYIYRLVFNVDGVIHADGLEYDFTAAPELQLPLMDTVGTNLLVLTETPEFIDAHPVMQVQPVNMALFYGLVAVAVVAFAVFLWFVMGVAPRPAKDDFDRFCTSLIREHEDRLVKLPSALSLHNDLVMTMTSVEDMVKAADELSQPIFYYIVDEEEERKAELYVFDDIRIYYFVAMGQVHHHANPAMSA